MYIRGSLILSRPEPLLPTLILLTRIVDLCTTIL